MPTLQRGLQAWQARRGLNWKTASHLLGKDEGELKDCQDLPYLNSKQNATVLSSGEQDISYEVFSGLLTEKGRWYRSFFMRGASNCKRGFDTTLGQTVPIPNIL